MTERVYIHEFVDVVGHNRARYMHHMTANWGPIGRAQRRQLCFGVWGVVGSTGRWPQVVNLWEYESWDDLAHNFEVELSSTSLQDPDLAEWWSVAAELRSGGTDRLLLAAEWSPGIEELCAAGTRGVGYSHELVGCRAGAAPELLDSIRDVGVAAHAESGLGLIGAFRRAMAADDEVIVVWSFDDWSIWADHERLLADGVSSVFDWRAQISDMTTTWDRILMVDAGLAPLRLGRQPVPSDRRPL